MQQPKTNLYNVTVKNNGVLETYGVVRPDLLSAIQAVGAELKGKADIVEARLASGIHFIG